MTGHVSQSLMHSKPADGKFDDWHCDFEIDNKMKKRERMKFLAIDARIFECLI